MTLMLTSVRLVFRSADPAGRLLFDGNLPAEWMWMTHYRHDVN